MIDVNNTDVKSNLSDIIIFAGASTMPNNMDENKQEHGVLPLETLPAEHYNFLFNRETLRFNNLFKCVKNMLSEFKNLLLGIGGITPSDNPSVTDQVQTFFNTNYPNTTIPTKVAAAAEITSADIDSQQGKSCAFAAEKTASGTSTIAKVTPPIPVFLGGTGASNAGDAAFNVLAGTPTTTLDGTESVLLQTTTGLIRKVGLGDLVAHMFDRMIPVGTVVWYLGPLGQGSIPNGWLVCDGKPVYKEAKYNKLVALLSDFSIGGRVSIMPEYFSIDLRGLSLMGAEAIGPQPYSGSVMGEYQADATSAAGLSVSGLGNGTFSITTLLANIAVVDPGHKHSYPATTYGVLGNVSKNLAEADPNNPPAENTEILYSSEEETGISLGLATGVSDNFTVSIDSTGARISSQAAETRAKNVRGAYLIKY